MLFFFATFKFDRITVVLNNLMVVTIFAVLRVMDFASYTTRESLDVCDINRPCLDENSFSIVDSNNHRQTVCLYPTLNAFSRNYV